MTIQLRAASLSMSLLLLLAGCGLAARNAADRPANAAGEDLDPFRYSDEFQPRDRSKYSPETPLEPGDSTAGPSATPERMPSDNSSGRTGASSDPSAALPGFIYRVQIGLSEDKEEMESLAERAERRLDLPVYIKFKAPYYRVQVGDFATADEAERQVKILKQRGYTNALRVMP